MSKTADDIHWCVTLLSTLAASGFYGDVVLQFTDGQLTLGRVNQTLKPAAAKFKDMTAQQYRMHQELQALLQRMGGTCGQEDA